MARSLMFFRDQNIYPILQNKDSLSTFNIEKLETKLNKNKPNLRWNSEITLFRGINKNNALKTIFNQINKSKAK